jgi:hypothetical protein
LKIYSLGCKKPYFVLDIFLLCVCKSQLEKSVLKLLHIHITHIYTFVFRVFDISFKFSIILYTGFHGSRELFPLIMKKRKHFPICMWKDRWERKQPYYLVPFSSNATETLHDNSKKRQRRCPKTCKFKLNARLLEKSLRREED